MCLWVSLCNTSNTVTYHDAPTKKEGLSMKQKTEFVNVFFLLIDEGYHCMSNSCEYRTSQGST